jgi:hypothetical protein
MMSPGIFARTLEDQLRRVKIQFSEMTGSSKYFDISPEELLNNAKVWFLRTILNAELMEDDMVVSAIDYVSNAAIERIKTQPYNLRFPAVAWITCSLDKEQIDSIFGFTFFNKISEVARQFNLMDQGSTFFPEKRRR